MSTGFEPDFIFKGIECRREPQFTVVDTWKDKKGTTPFESASDKDIFYIDFKLHKGWTQKENKTTIIELIPFGEMAVICAYTKEDLMRLWVSDGFEIIRNKFGNGIIRYAVQIISIKGEIILTKEDLESNLWGDDGGLTPEYL